MICPVFICASGGVYLSVQAGRIKAQIPANKCNKGEAFKGHTVFALRLSGNLRSG
jgi:hypothetical protein